MGRLNGSSQAAANTTAKAANVAAVVTIVTASQEDCLRVVGGGSAVSGGVTRGGLTGAVSGTTGTARSIRQRVIIVALHNQKQ